MAAIAAVAIAVLSGCGSDFGSGATPSPSSDGNLPPTISVFEGGKPFEEVVVGGVGLMFRHALYRFDKDDSRPSVSRCAGECEELWHPVRFSEDIVFDRQARGALGSFVRPDGFRQLTIGGWPAYTYDKDHEGKITGHGKDGQWWAIAPDGSKAKKRQ